MSAQCADSMSIQRAINACIALRDAVAAADSTAMRASADSLAACDVISFHQLNCCDSIVNEMPSAHLDFMMFADSLASNTRGQRDTHRQRGQSADGSIRTKTCFAKARQSTRYTFRSRGRQELAVVPEAGGRVTLRIHVTNRQGLDQRYDDTRNISQGMSHRRTVFDLPANISNIVELEVLNCTDGDISFVVISN